MTTSLRLRALAACCAALALVAGWAAPARAWTRASVAGAAAHLEVGEEGEAHVALEVELRVHGGWLSTFELGGLDPDLALDAHAPPWFQCEDGTRLTPEVQVSAGRVVLSFSERRSAPRRGLHRIGIAYTTHLAASAARGATRLAWSLPPWSEDLENVHVWVDAPRSARWSASEDADIAMLREREERGARALLHFSRAQLPRTMPFAIELDLPGDLTAARPARAVQEARAPQLSPAAAWAALLVLALVSIKRRAVRSLCAHHAARAVPLLALSPAGRASVMVALAIAASFAYERQASLSLACMAAIVLLGLDRGFARRRAIPPASRGDRLLARARDWFGAAAWLDATAPLGLGLLGCAYALAAFRLALHGRPGLWLETLLLVTPLWLTGTRLQISSSAAGRPAPDPAA